jgi:hypothetical protein
MYTCTFFQICVYIYEYVYIYVSIYIIFINVYLYICRLKTNIQQLEEPLHKVSKLRGVYFKWNNEQESGLHFDDHRHVGLMAQDVQAVLPEVVQELGLARYVHRYIFYVYLNAYM